MLFKSKKDEPKKEFIQYKDGKIVSVDVEQPRKPKGVIDFEEIPLYQEMEPKKEKVPFSEKAKGWMTLKKLKVVVGIVVLVLFTFALMDVYQAFFSGADEQEPQPKIEEQQPPSKTKEKVAEQPSEKPSEKPVSTPSEILPKPPAKESNAPTAVPKEEPEKPSSSTPKERPASDSALKASLDVSNMVNQVIVSQSSNEIRYINDYADRKANKIGLNNQLDRTLNEKQKAYGILTMNKGQFNDSALKTLYQATEKRLMSSILFTQNAKVHIQEARGKEALRAYANDYTKTDETLRVNQVKAFESVLQDHGISYTTNELTKNIEFTLP